MGRALILSDRVQRLRVKDHQLRARLRDSDDELRAPCEDLDVIVLDSIERIDLDTHVLRELAEAKCILLANDRTHHPAGMFVPFGTNLDHGAITTAQCEMSQPRKKQAWKQIVQRKIRNQAASLPSRSGAQMRLLELQRNVQSGDATNVEAQAARVYWAAVLPAGVRRGARTRTGVNAALDYGYAVLRASVARACAAAGLHLGLPLFHSNRANPFALVDDLVEPWRPLVDRRALSLGITEGVSLTPAEKVSLVGALQDPVRCGGTIGPAAEAISRMTSSVKRYVLGESKALDLPELLDGDAAQ
jgi:CRISPR-associated protein Cas1